MLYIVQLHVSELDYSLELMLIGQVVLFQEMFTTHIPILLCDELCGRYKYKLDDLYNNCTKFNCLLELLLYNTNRTDYSVIPLLDYLYLDSKCNQIISKLAIRITWETVLQNCASCSEIKHQTKIEQYRIFLSKFHKTQRIDPASHFLWSNKPAKHRDCMVSKQFLGSEAYTQFAQNCCKFSNFVS